VIELRTLGAIDLRVTGEERDLTPALLQSKRLALLVYLAVAQPRGFHSRDILMSLFWPELDTGRARNSLRQALFFLRSTLGPRVVGGRGIGEVGLVKGELWCDAVAFDEAIAARDYQRAVELYRGDFLVGFHATESAPDFEWWLDRERRRIRRDVQVALRTLADREEAAGRPQAAAGLLRRGVLIDPEDERSTRRLMALLGSLGDRASAIQVYQELKRTLEEYGVDPSPETQAVLRAVREREESALDLPLPATRASVLPIPLTTLIGREREIQNALGLLQRTDTQLLTLTGPGGCGKTRLALEIAGRWGTEGVAPVVPVYFVPLAGTRTPGLVMATVARAVGAPKGGGSLQAVKRHLSQRNVFLVLDNVEHVVEAAADIVALLDAAPGVKILTTSRIPLRVRAERVLDVPPLTAPGPGTPATAEGVGGFDAVALFVDRARAVDVDFRLTDENARAVAEICRRLDGLPLAIELAAARTRLFSPEALAARLDAPLSLLKHGPRDMPERHRAMESTIRWSYELLPAEEKMLFRRAALFVGGGRLDVIARMWQATGGERDQAVDLVASLVDKNLFQRGDDADGRTRIEMLETIRAFGLAELDAHGETEEWCRWQADYWLSWVEPGEGYYCTLEEAPWMNRIDREHENIRAALGWALAAGEVESALRLATALWWYWWTRGAFEEGRRWLEKALNRAQDVEPALRAKALFGLAMLASGQGDHSSAIARLEESLTMQRALDDRHGVAVLLQNLGWAYRERGDRERAEALFKEALELRREMEDRRGMALALEGLGGLAAEAGGFGNARPMLEQALWLAQEVGDRQRAAHVLLTLADLAGREGDDGQAEALYERALERFRVIKHIMGVGQALSKLAEIARRRGAADHARELYAEALQLYRDTGYGRRIASNLIGFAALALTQGRADRSARMGGGIDALTEAMSVVLERDEIQLYEETMAAAREDLGSESFAEEWSAGRRMTADETITLALQLTTAGPGTPRMRRTAGS
jgi:predicted ATPase/DNA-binding SARP family transcriptional activator/uncharacterized protein HemY